ncbi:MAG TPA: hypothetical protein VF245_08570 [Solirubrobacterales bacterium]
MASERRRKPLLASGNEEEWARINRKSAVEATWRDRPFRVAALRTLVGFKRLAGRGQDRLDLENLENANGELPIDEIPGLDT